MGFFVRAAKAEEYDIAIDFYYSLIDDMENEVYHPAWKKEIYPSREYIKSSIAENSLYLAYIDDVLAGAMIINNKANEGFDKADWEGEAKSDEISVIHALAIGYRYMNKGYGKCLLNEAVKICKAKNQKLIRLDVLGGNLPAFRLYDSFGFKHIASIKLYYEDTGLTDYDLFEYII